MCVDARLLFLAGIADEKSALCSAHTAVVTQRNSLLDPRAASISAVGKTADRESKKRPAPEATTEDKKAAAATQKLASNAPVTDSDLDALLPDEGFETLANQRRQKRTRP